LQGGGLAIDSGFANFGSLWADGGNKGKGSE
jgi:hypothetical protein